MQRKNKIVKVLVIAFACFFIAIFVSKNPVGAVSYQGPDPNDYGDSKALYIVAHTPSNTTKKVYNQTLLQVPIYYYNPGADGVAQSPKNNVTLTVYSINRGISGYTPINQYISVKINNENPVNDRFITKKDIIVKANSFTLDKRTMIYRAVVDIRLYNGLKADWPDWRYMNQVSFRLVLPKYKDRWIIGNSIPGGRFSTIAANVSPGQKTDTYNIPFATPCDIEKPTNGTIHLYDLDDGGGDNEYHNITEKIFRVNKDGSKTQISFKASGNSGNRGDYKLTMKFRKSQKYILRISGISPINLLQYSFPYEGVNYLVPCPTPSSLDYELTPSVGLDSDFIEAGSKVTASLSVDNSGDVNASANWKLSRTINGALPSTVVSDDNGTKVDFKANDTTEAPVLPDYIDTDTDKTVGTRLCYILSVKPHSSTDPNWVYSEEDCVVVGKRPKARVYGGDLNVRGDVKTSVTTKSAHTFGSWAEYGIIASGGITGAASGAAFSGPGLANATVCRASPLSFANATNMVCDNSGPIGNYNSQSDLPAVAANFPGSNGNITGNVAPNSLNSGTYTATNVTLTQSSLSAGKTIVIKASGTVRISDDLEYNNGPYTKINQLPQLVIIAKDIIINSDVKRVDAWLVASNDSGTGTIKTCELEAKIASQCTNPLVVNGPVIVDKLYLYRTAGSEAGAASGDPAEVFNLRADAYFWAISKSTNTSKIRTVYTTELPPRF